MKIYILPVEGRYFNPPKIRAWCEHSPNFTAETDFYNFIRNSEYVTRNPDEADWHYLPMMWSYWQLANNYGRDNRPQMEQYLKTIVKAPEKTFTISEADWEPNFEIKMKVFSANTTDNGWTAIPLMTLPHKLPDVIPQKEILASFVGNVSNWPMRLMMNEVLRNREDTFIVQSKKGEELFVKTMLMSYTALCPRGSALGSYRFYEAMQLGVVPIMISDYDFRPFKDKINWDEFSYFLSSPEKLPVLLDSLDKDDLLIKGKLAQHTWDRLSNQGWCRMVMEYL